LRQVLDDLTPMIAVRWSGRPREEAAVRAALGHGFLALGEPARAVQQLRLAWSAIEPHATEDPKWSTLVLHYLSRAERQAQEPDASRKDLVRMLELGANAVAATSPELSKRLSAIATELTSAGEHAAEVVSDCDRLLILLAGMDQKSDEFLIGGRLLAAVGLALQSDHCPGSDDLVQRLEATARKVLGEDVDFLGVLVNFAESQLRAGQGKAALDLASEVLAGLQRQHLTGHWLQAQAERIRGQALVLSGEPAAGETALLALRERLIPFAASGNQHVTAAYAALGELCGRLAQSGTLDGFLRASLSSWLRARSGNPATAPWWPSTFDDLPAAVTDAALNAVEAHAVQAMPPELEAVRGALLLRAGKFAAAGTSLESLHRSVKGPWPELLADLALSRHRNGDAAGAKAAVAELLQLATAVDASADATMQIRRDQAQRRVETAGLR
jgi:hypothetical protein